MSVASENLAASIRQHYRRSLLRTGKASPSVFAFCEDFGIEEKAFYTAYNSLNAVEAACFAEVVERTLAVLQSDAEAGSYDARQKLFAFYFTLLEEAKAERSFLLLRFPRVTKGCLPCDRLKKMQAAFTPFAEDWVRQALNEDILTDKLRLEEWLPRVLFPQLLSVLEFFLDDESENFERSDAFVEKSIRLFLDLGQAPILESGIDLLRFLLGSSHSRKSATGSSSASSCQASS